MPPSAFAGDEAGSAARATADMAASATKCASRRIASIIRPHTPNVRGPALQAVWREVRWSAPVAADVGGELALRGVRALLQMHQPAGGVVERSPRVPDHGTL